MLAAAPTIISSVHSKNKPNHMNKLDIAVHLMAPMMVNASLKEEDLEAYADAALKAADILMNKHFKQVNSPTPHTCEANSTQCFRCGKLLENET
jgi:hypothetical protein